MQSVALCVRVLAAQPPLQGQCVLQIKKIAIPSIHYEPVKCTHLIAEKKKGRKERKKKERVEKKKNRRGMERAVRLCDTRGSRVEGWYVHSSRFESVSIRPTYSVTYKWRVLDVSMDKTERLASLIPLIRVPLPSRSHPRVRVWTHLNGQQALFQQRGKKIPS